MLREQPSPTQSDGTLRNMVDSDTGKDQGGNPLGEGTIMGSDGEQPVWKRDNYMHGHVLAALVDPHHVGERDPELGCPSCGSEVMFDPKSEDAWCSKCDWQRMVHRDEPWGAHHEIPAEMEEGKHYVAPGGESMQGFVPTNSPEWLQFYREFPKHQGAVTILSMDDLLCPNCREEVVVNPQSGNIQCPGCQSRWPVHQDAPPTHDPVQHMIRNDQFYAPYEQETKPDGMVLNVRGEPKYGVLLRTDEKGNMTGRERLDENGQTIEEPYSYLRWEPGYHGRGLMVGGQPHTWNAYHPNQLADATETKPEDFGVFHSEYPASVGIHPDKVDWKSGVEIDPTGAVIGDASPYIHADPRLKLVEDPLFPTFESSVPNFESFTRNMDPYDSWEHLADVLFDKGPDENIPSHSLQVQPGRLGLHNNTLHYLNFLDAHINGVPVRGNHSDLMRKHGLRESSDFGQPVIVSVHHPAHLPAAADQIQYEGVGPAPRMKEVGLKVQSGELPPPPGVNVADIAPPRTASWLVGPAAEMAAGLGGGEAAGGAAGLMGGAGGGLGQLPLVGGLMSRVMGGGPQQQEQSQLTSEYESPLKMGSVLEAFVSHYETPASNPDVGTKHDDPEDVDQKEFNDQDKSPKNLKNPETGEEGGATKGEDEVRDEAGFGPNSPAIERMEMLLPLLLHYYHSDESGANDPLIKGLHEMLDGEMPGYLEKGDPEHAEKFIIGLKTPDHVHAAFPVDPNSPQLSYEPPERGSWQCAHCGLKNGAIYATCDRCGAGRNDPATLDAPQHPDPMMDNEPGTMTFPQEWTASQKEAIVPSIPGITNESYPVPMPSSAQPAGGGVQGGHCGTCGGVLDGTGSCPQCGQSANQPMQQMSPMPAGSAFQQPGILGAFMGASHQGPVTPEQIAAVQQWLIENGRVEEVSNVPLDPGNPEYVKILAEIQNKPNVAPTIAPQEQTPPPPPMAPPGGGMPMPGMNPAEGGQPMQPMSSFLPDFTAADNVAERCPNCGSGTTGMVGDDDHTQHCHSCAHKWTHNDLVDDTGTAGNTSIASVRQALDHVDNEHANPLGVPAVEQEGHLNQGGDQDSSLTWQDTEGQPIQSGQEYAMHSPKYDIPDMIKVQAVKPDGLQVQIIGTFANEPEALAASAHISKEEMELQKLVFEPVAQNADERNNEPPQGREAPGESQIPQSGQTTDEHDNSYPPYESHVKDGVCSKCGHDDKESFMLSSTKVAHSCYRCGNIWTEEESAEGDEAHLAAREWVMDDDDGDEFSERMASMAKARQQTRNIHSVAERDSRLQAIKEHLNHQKMERTAGKNFTPSEQRTLIDEDGVARNADLLLLEGTHYREDFTGKANADNVPDEHVLFGLM